MALSDPQFNITPIYFSLVQPFGFLPPSFKDLILKKPNVSALLQSFFEVNELHLKKE